jgi:hypothetical protein
MMMNNDDDYNEDEERDENICPVIGGYPLIFSSEETKSVPKECSRT